MGKTTTSCALAMALAQQGHRTLVVSVDPARRLAQALGIEVSSRPQQVPLPSGTDGREGTLVALMPEPREAASVFVDMLFEEDEEAKRRVLDNRFYQTLSNALAGIHEMVSLMMLAHEVRGGRYDCVVLDTAPSRNAVDLLTYPGRLATLVEGRALQWFASLGFGGGGSGRTGTKKRPGWLALGRKTVEAAVGRLLDPATLDSMAELFAELFGVRERFVDLASRCQALVLGPTSEHWVVTAPTGSAVSDAEYLGRKLRAMGVEVHTIVLNRADVRLPEWITTLRAAETHMPESLGPWLTLAEQEAQHRVVAGDRAANQLSSSVPGARPVRLPAVQDPDPTAVVRALSRELGVFVSLQQ